MRQHVTLVLSSGGSRGLAHIGVIEELEKSGYIIDAVAGCSMGSLVGGVYAAGGLQQLKEWFLDMTLKKMFALSDIQISARYVMKGEKIISAIEKMVPERNIEDLDIPFACVATDIAGYRQKVFDHGPLFQAIRASMSLPIIFQPVTNGDEILVDGGLLNALPIDLVRKTPGSKLIAVNLNTLGMIERPKQKRPLSMTELIDRTFDLSITDNTMRTLSKYKPDILVNIPIYDYGSYDFDKAAEIIEIGRRAMHEAL